MYLKRSLKYKISSSIIYNHLLSLCNKFSKNKPVDDTIVAVMNFRKRSILNILIEPTTNKGLYGKIINNI